MAAPFFGIDRRQFAAHAMPPIFILRERQVFAARVAQPGAVMGDRDYGYCGSA